MDTKIIQLLLAEDNRDQQQLLLRALVRGRPCVNVTVVDNGAEFLRALDCQRFDCAIVDFHLPDYRADELLVASKEKRRGCPALVISSSLEQQVVIRSIRSGGADYVPMRAATQGEELWSRVEYAIGMARRQRLERRKAERRTRLLANLAEHDDLTGLYNRRYFDRCLRQNRWVEDRRKNLGCVMVDVDRFKSINDSFGHTAGDDLLREVARVIRRNCLDSDVTIRWGGEEFLILRPTPDATDLWLWAEQLRVSIESSVIQTSSQRLHVTASTGIIQVAASAFNQSTIDHADQALYLAKKQGRNMVCTAVMANHMKIATEIAAKTDLSFEQKRGVLLEQLSDQLGPTQRTHVTIHCQQVAAAAQRIALRMKLSSRQVEHLRLAGLLHDIGKIMIPEDLLAKPRTLSVQEWAIMGRHDCYGQWIAKELGAPDAVLEHCRHHHTRFDESADEEISLGARILCVADAMVTMMSRRSYQAAITDEKAILELIRERNRQFAPVVVDAATSLERADLQYAA
ncbi:MAG: diguanylate cyclase [Phycisphaeraceae bacterium]